MRLTILNARIDVHGSTSWIVRDIACRFSAFVTDAEIQSPSHHLYFTETAKTYRVNLGTRRIEVPKGISWPRPSDFVQLLVEKTHQELRFVHGSHVSMSHGSVIFVGSSTTGKTTIALGLEKRGWTMGGEDTCPIDPASGESFCYMTTPNVRTHTHTLLDNLSPKKGVNSRHNSTRCNISAICFLENKGVRTVQRSIGNDRLELWRNSVQLIYGLTPNSHLTRTTTIPFFDQTSFYGDASIAPCLESEALRLLMRHAHFSPMSVPQQFSGIVNLVAKIPCYRLIVGDLMSTLMLVEKTFDACE